MKTFFLLLGMTGVAGWVQSSPIQYNFNFTGGTPGATGSFDYDTLASSNPFTSFLVAIDGFTFDFTSNANGKTATGCGGATGPQSVFNALIGDTGAGCGSQEWGASLGPGFSTFVLLNGTSFNLVQDISAGPSGFVNASGTFTATAAAPEPGTLALFFAGAGALLAWKRAWLKRM